MLNLEVLRQGAKGEAVEMLQGFLRGQGYYLGVVDGDFGPKTKVAVELFQRAAGCKPIDGIVGNGTWGAAMARGLDLLPSDSPADERTSPNWPPKPAGLSPISAAERERIFGSFDFVHEPLPDNPENIRITKRSAEYKIVEVSLPKLIGVQGFPRSGKVLFHAKGADQLRALVDAWDTAKLLPLIIRWSGTLVTRFVRGSRKTLSNHAWGNALDINSSQNALASRPALVGQRGSVRELVPLAIEHGFFWGGHFRTPDGMHKELREAR